MLNRKGETFTASVAKYHEEDNVNGSNQTSIHVEIILPG